MDQKMKDAIKTIQETNKKMLKAIERLRRKYGNS